MDEQEKDDCALESQLASELDDAVHTALKTRRPLLTHLNADTSWLLSLPVPVPEPGGHLYYHMLIDPWLQGSQSDVAAFFSTQWHREESAVQTVAEVEDIVRGIESAASGQSYSDKQHDNDTMDDDTADGLGSQSPIDAVLISHEFTDHMHQPTLLTVPRSVPVFATSVAAGRIRPWAHFSTVISLPNFGSNSGRGSDWRSASLSPLPRWIGIARLVSEKMEMEAVLNYHSALVVAFSTSADPEKDDDSGGAAEAIIYTPHGISAADLTPVAVASPPLKTLALLHGLHDIRLGSQLNLGAHNGLKAQRLTGARYWVGTHDEVKRGGGLVSWFLRREVLSVGQALERELDEGGGDGLEVMKGVDFEEVGNGGSLVLE